MQIDFYVLTGKTANKADGLMVNTLTDELSVDVLQAEKELQAFVCRLTETVLAKSEQTLVILDDNAHRLKQLDDRLWALSPTSFIPHELCLHDAPLYNAKTTHDVQDSHNKPTDKKEAEAKKDGQGNANITNRIAPVILTNQLPDGFTGVVLNLADAPLPIADLQKNRKMDDNKNIETSTEKNTTTNSQASDSKDAQSPVACPSRLLEIIQADDSNKQKGRLKYKHYQTLGYRIGHHQVP